MLQLMKPGFGTIKPEDGRAHEEWVETLMRQDYVIERWQCDLSTGIFSVGETAKIRHGLDHTLCGLLDIIRGYHEDHLKTVLNILEEATASASSFCFCTTLQDADGAALPVFCIGTSSTVPSSLGPSSLGPSSLGPSSLGPSSLGPSGTSAGASRMQGIFAFTPLEP